MQAPGDEITFLKRRMVLQHDSRLTVQMHHKHVDQMCSLLGLNKKLQGKKSPGHADMDQIDTTGEVSPQMAKPFRTCIGILLYLAPDLQHCQHVVRHLATYSTQPTAKSLTVLKHLVSYLAGHESICISLKWKGRNVGLFQRRARRINYGDLHRFRLGVGQTNTAFCFMFNDLPGRLPCVFSFTNSEAVVFEQCRGRGLRLLKWSIRWSFTCEIGVMDERFQN